MQKFGLILAFVFGFGAPVLADPVIGIWKTQVDDGAYAHVKFSSCGAKLCGKIARSFKAGAEYKSPNMGRKLVWDMVADGGGHYSGGQIWQPSKDKVYKSKMSLSGNKLYVSGCWGIICKKQTWTRVK
jgi:uncharacterized protein (DUF2147 family)